jgi:hypothetical protein
MEEIVSRTTWPVYSPFAKEHFGRGKKEGRLEGLKEGFIEGFLAGRREGGKEGMAKAVLKVLAARGVKVPDDVRARIRECTDQPQLETWLARAVVATSATDLFD